MVIFLIDPFKQLNKAEDTQRKSDFKQIRSGLDTYMHDTNCFPSQVSFGSEWKIDETLYMKKIPQDPDYPKQCYFYATDEFSSCPQWHVLFAKLAISPRPGDERSCPLSDSCLPANFEESGFTYCDFAGEVNCEYISSKSLPEDGCAGWGIPTPAVSPTPTNTPGGLYFCACGANHMTVCNIGSGQELEGVTTYSDIQCSNQCGTPC